MISLEMRTGRDPRVLVDGVDVTARVTSVELIPGGRALVHMNAVEDAAVGATRRQVLQDAYEVVP